MEKFLCGNEIECSKIILHKIKNLLPIKNIIKRHFHPVVLTTILKRENITSYKNNIKLTRLKMEKISTSL